GRVARRARPFQSIVPDRELGFVAEWYRSFPVGVALDLLADLEHLAIVVEQDVQGPGAFWEAPPDKRRRRERPHVHRLLPHDDLLSLRHLDPLHALEGVAQLAAATDPRRRRYRQQLVGRVSHRKGVGPTPPSLPVSLCARFQASVP